MSLTLDSISQKVRDAEYAVRGELAIRANKLAEQLKSTKKEDALPFDEIIYCNIGNPQSLGQQPLTYFRQLLAAMEYPALLDSPHASSLFPKDVIARARRSLDETPGGLGAYSHSQGLAFVRRSIADFIERRDGYPCNPEHLFIHNGASPAVQDCLKLLIRDEKDGIMVPIPQYPLYSASIVALGGTMVPYYLNEQAGWTLTVEELRKAYDQSVADGVKPRALCVINPGNPTGQVLPGDNIEKIFDFCQEKKLILMADEVYQENNYIESQRPFVSFKKVLKQKGDAFKDFILFSFLSISKGVYGECGHRSGYVEVVGVDDDVRNELYKLASIQLCPNTAGQILMDVMVNPPKEGEQSYESHRKEKQDVYDSLKRRAEKLVAFFNTLPGISVNPAEGAMYAFVKIDLPDKAIKAAEKAGKRPDDFYSISLLNATGICVVPGSGFGQEKATFHFRTTFLPQEEKFDGIMERFGKFHKQFMADHS